MAQEKLGFKSFPNIATYGALVTKYKNKTIFSFNGNVAADANKSYHLNVVYNNAFDSVQTNLFNLTNNPSGSFFGIFPFTNKTNKLFYWGVGDYYGTTPVNEITFVFGNVNQTNLTLTNHKAYHSKYYHRPEYIHTFLNDTTFVSVHNFKWYHPSSLPYGTSIWWFNTNMDTLQQKVYFEASGNAHLTPHTVYPLANKDILVAGFTDTLNASIKDAFLMRLDSTGNVKYARSIGTNGNENLYLTKVDSKYYFIGTSAPDVNYQNPSVFYTAEVNINDGSIGKTYKAAYSGTLSLISMQDPSVQQRKIYLPSMIALSSTQYNRACYFLIDTNGVISKQYIHSQASNGYWNSYTLPITTASLKNVYGSIIRYNTNSDPTYTVLFKLDSNLIACYPSDTPFSFTTTIATGALHSIPMSIITAKDSIFEVTTPGAIVQGHGFNTMVDECSSFVGIEEDAIQNQYVKIYPNPANEIINIELEMLNDKEELIIYNTFGALVYQAKINTQHSTFNIQHLSSGMYFIKIATATKILFNSKLNVVK